MPEAKKAKVGLLGLMVELYDQMFPGLRPAMAEFGKELAQTLSPFAEVDFPSVCNSREQVDRTVAQFEAEGKDLVIVVLLTYAPSHIAVPSLARTSLPILIFNTQQLQSVTEETLSMDTTKNHGVHAVQELANVLLRAGRRFQIVTGHYQDPTTLARVKSWCDAARTARFMRQVRIGLVGYPAEGMGDIFFDETALVSHLGVEVHHLGMKAIADQARAAPGRDIADQMASDRDRFRVAKDVTPAEHEASARLEWALRNLLLEQGMHGVTYNFGAVDQEGQLDTLPFLAASKLLAEGYGFGGEGDVGCATAVALMKELVGEANFTEMFTMDYANNSVLMMHMGECNWKMARRSEPIHLVRNTLAFGSLRVNPVLLAFSLEPGEVTLVSLATLAASKFKLIVTEGQVLDFPFLPDLARPHFKFRPDGDLKDFLTQFSLEGGTHHQALVYGRRANTVKKTAELLGIECAHI